MIGPNEPRRWEVSSVLAECRGISVREFTSYPTALDDAPRLLERYFDVIVIDLDSDPEFALRLVAGICAENSAMVMVYSEKSDRELMGRCLRAGAREYLVLPFDKGALAKALERARIGAGARDRSGQKSTGDLLVFLGAKGGAGVTTIACNIAIALAHEPVRNTLLIDLAVPLGDAALSLGIAAQNSTDNALRDPERLDARFLLSLLARHRSGVYVLAAPSKVPEVEASKPAIDKLIAVARQQFDHVIVDVGSRIDLMGTDLFQKASTIYLVTRAGISELRNSNRLISQFFSEDSPRLQIVLNRFAPHLQAGVNEEVISKALGRPVHWKIPDDQDPARPLQAAASTLSASTSPVSRIILEMAAAVTGLPVSSHLVFGNEASADAATESPSLNAPSPNPAVESQGPAAAPVVNWPTPDPITYGTPLSGLQLNASASAAGSLIFTPGPGYTLPAGTHTLWVTFTPSNAAGEPALQSSVTISVSKATPAIDWPAPPDLAPGTALGASHLNATAAVPGEFAYSPANGEVLGVGTHTLSVTFTPADTANFNSAQASVQVTVARQTPTLQWRSPDPIAYGTALGSAQLNASASVPGTLAYTPASGEILPAGTHTLSVAFTPADEVHYSPVQSTVRVEVSKAAPRIVWPEPDPITYGELLSTRQLNASSPVPGTFVYTPGTGATLSAGIHTPSVDFTPADFSNYESAHAAVQLTVAKAMPVIEWPCPDPISAGAALGPLQLNATASVPGAFHYAPAAGELLTPGSHDLSVTFTPADTLNYTIAEAIVSLAVVEKLPFTIDWPSPSAISYGTPLGEAQLRATASVQGTFTYSPPAGNVLPAGRHKLSAAFTPADTLRHTPAQATVELIVQQPAKTAAPGSTASGPDSAVLAAVAWYDAPSHAEPEFAAVGVSAARNSPRETRTYKGAIYEKGEDGKWHLQQT